MENVPYLLSKIEQEKGQAKIDACTEIVHLCGDDRYKCVIMSNSNLIPVIVDVINEDTGSARLLALDAIANLALDNENVVQMTSSDYGLLPAIVKVLNQENSQVWEMACLATQNLAVVDPVSICMASPDLGLLSALANVIEKENGEAQLNAFGTIWNISSVKDNIIHIVAPDLQLLNLIIKIINLKSGETRQTACGVLNNICYYADYHIANLLLKSQIHISMLDILKQGGPVPSEWQSKGDHISEMLRCLMKLSRQSCA
eukprot:gene16531-34448_t